MVGCQAWSERVRKLLPPIKALRSRNLVSLEQLVVLQQQVGVGRSM